MNRLLHLPRISGVSSIPQPLHWSINRHGLLKNLESPNDAIVDLLIAGLAKRYGMSEEAIVATLASGATVI